MLEQEHPQDHGRGRARAPAPAAQRMPAAKGGVDQLDEGVIVQDLVDRPELVIPELVPVRQQHLEDAALSIRATDHGAPIEAELVRCAVGGHQSITDDNAATRKYASRKLTVLPRAGRHSPRKSRASAVSFAPGSS